MRRIVPSLFGMILSAGIVHSQERIAMPAPDPVQPGQPLTMPAAPLTDAQPSNVLPGPAVTGPEYPGPDGLAPYPPYPPPGVYGPGRYPRPAIFVDPENPSFWVGVDALIWWSRSQPLPAYLVTTGPASSGSDAGGLGVPGTTSLTSPLNYGAQGGAQLYIGGWFTPSHRFGMDGSLFFLGSRVSGWTVSDRSGTGSLVINEPVAGAPFITQVSAPGVQTGNVTVDSVTRFGGGDLNLLYNAFRGNGWSLNLLGGFRGLELNESLNITANSSLFVTTNYTDNFGNVLASATPGSIVTVVDQFTTRNQFYGGQVGAQLRYSGDRWDFDAVGKFAIGNTHETVIVDGSTGVFPVNGNPVYLSGGNYATLQMGRCTANHFAVAPTLQLKLGYQFTPFLRGTIGYNFMYLSSVVRPGNQIDNIYDGNSRPTVPFANSGFWTQGINLGLHFSF